MKFSAVILALIPTLALCQDDMACPGAPSDADCETCLNAGCVTAVGQCMSSCSFIADASCWDMQYHTNSTVEEVCAIKAMQEADAAICGDEAAQSDCGTCTSTLKSDGVSTCQWYSPIGASGYCGAGGCDMMGTCGSEVCDLGASGPCGGFTECEPCLNSRLECAWTANSCQPSCGLIMDVACYHPSESAFANMTGPEICAIAASTEDGPFDMPPDNTTMDDMGDSHPCNGFELCEPCLNSRMECAWIADSCQPSCDVIADAACYHPSESAFANMTGPEICAFYTSSVEVPFDASENATMDGEEMDPMESVTDGEEDVAVERGAPAPLESAAISRVFYATVVAAVGVATTLTFL